VQPARLSAIAAGFAASLVLSACETTTPSGPNAGVASPTTAGGVLQRDLTPQEKQAIVDSVSPSLRNPGAAKYRWAKFPTVVTEESVNYCGSVDAQSPFAAYNGHQAYIV
jgi:hypothetical protein